MKILFRLQLTQEEYEQLFYITGQLKAMRIPCLLKEILIEYFNQEEFTTEDNIKVAYIFSKEIEHDDENIDTILEDISLGMI